MNIGKIIRKIGTEIVKTAEYGIKVDQLANGNWKGKYKVYIDRCTILE